MTPKKDNRDFTKMKYIKRGYVMNTLFQRVENADSNFLRGLALCFDRSETKVQLITMDHWNDYKSCKYLIEEITKEDFDAKLQLAKNQLK